MSAPHRSLRALVPALALALTPVATLPALMLAASALRIPLDRTECIVLALLATGFGAALAITTSRELDATGRSEDDRALRGVERVIVGTIAVLTIGGTAIVAAMLGAVADARPVIDWDGLYYHVPAVHAWALAGRIVWIDSVPDVPFVNGYPMALEALALWSVQVFGHDRWIDATNLAAWPAGLLGLVLLARSLGARGPYAWIAGAALAGVPAIVVATATAYVDVGFACASAATFALTLVLLRGVRSWSTWLLWGIALGLLMGVKGTGIPLAALLVLAVSLRTLATARGDRALAVRMVSAGAITALLVGGGWPLRALVHTGNPIHPIELRLGAKVLAPGYDAHAAADLAMPADLRDLPAPLRAPATWLRPFEPVTVYDQTEGLGPLWTFAGLPALLGCAVLALRRRDAAVLVLLVTAGIWWLAQPAAWWARFSLWIVILGWPFAVALVAEPRATAWRNAGLVTLSIVLLATASVVGPVLVHERNWTTRHGLVHDEPSGALDAIAVRWPTMRSNESFARALAEPNVARTRIDRLGTLFAGALAQPIGRRSIAVIEDDHAARMRELGIRWLWWDEAAAGTPGEEHPAGLIEAGRFDLGGSAVRLFELR